MIFDIQKEYFGEKIINSSLPIVVGLKWSIKYIFIDFNYSNKKFIRFDFFLFFAQTT